MTANMDRKEPPRANSPACDLCSERVEDYIINPCNHVFCWPCILKFRNESTRSRGNCPTCYFNQPLQLVSTPRPGQLQLEESALQRCFLECEDCPVYVISVVGQRRTGKSFLMNYLMRVLRSLEKKNKHANLGGDNEALNGFPWRPGTDKVTEGIWIWGKPFLVENKGKKVAVFLLDTEGTNNTTRHEPASIKLFVLTMMISSHLVYNVKADVKEKDIDYLEIYSDPMEDDPYHPFFGLKYFDVLVRDWHDSEECDGAEVAESYIKRHIQNLGKLHMEHVLKLVEERMVRCFLMPHPGVVIVEDKGARLRDMDEDFQNKLRIFLMDVVERIQNCSSAMTCTKMAEKLKVCMEHVQNQRYISSPNELCSLVKSDAEKKTMKEMERINAEFQEFLNNQTWWKLPGRMSALVSEKVSELIIKFHQRSLLIRDEHHQNLMGMLLDQLKEKGDKFCDTHVNNLKYNGLRAAVHVGLAAAATAAMPLLFPAAAPVAATTGWFSTIGGWFSAAPAATAAASSELVGVAAAGVAMLQTGAAFLLRRIW